MKNNIFILLALVLFGCNSSSSKEAEEPVAAERAHIKESADGSNAPISQANEQKAEKPINTFTSEPSIIAEDFFDWYAGVTNNQETNEYQAKFVADKEGMMTLDYTQYIANLRRLHFSEELINQEVENYSNCINSIKSFKYAEREKHLEEIEDYESIGCDFFNSFRWTKSMDNFDGARVIGEEIKGNSAEVKVQLYNYDAGKKEFYYWNEPYMVKLKKDNGKWEIVNL
ncbi:hypothetical protein H8S95_05875 [Pontibacter sp. KCTC 32443]|uniref:hypothetical protein n=1 Tax=Pontibacter TaxID=323449 RepID=UPI00164D5EBD|nr:MULTISPECIES: hypothetical protein [Pontibacter]MBC5773585.1 hypothetical protein [Pontibacter sp. KCTC 32443]